MGDPIIDPVGTELLRLGCQNYLDNWDVGYLLAEVKKANKASVRIFEKAGFKVHEEDEEQVRMRLYR